MESADKKINWYAQDNNKADASIFCSENLARAWKLPLWSLLPKWIPADQYAPFEFREGQLVDKILEDRFNNVHLFKNIYLDVTIRLK
jgi:hypothetical protein